MLLADIAEDILGMDLMNMFGFTLGLKNGIFCVKNEEVYIHWDNDLLQIIFVDNVTLPEWE